MVACGAHGAHNQTHRRFLALHGSEPQGGSSKHPFLPVPSSGGKKEDKRGKRSKATNVSSVPPHEPIPEEVVVLRVVSLSEAPSTLTTYSAVICTFCAYKIGLSSSVPSVRLGFVCFTFIVDPTCQRCSAQGPCGTSRSAALRDGTSIAL